MAWIQIDPEDMVTRAKRIDTVFWSRTLEKMPVVRKKMPRMADKLIGADIFNSFYQWKPELSDKPKDKALAAWLRNMLKQEEVQFLRRQTMGDEIQSAIAAVKFYQEMMRPKKSELRNIANIKERIDAANSINPEIGKASEEGLERLREMIAKDIDKGVDGQSIDKADEGEVSKADVHAMDVNIEKAAGVAVKDLQAITSLASVMGGDGFSLGGDSMKLLDLVARRRSGRSCSIWEG